MYSVFQLLSLTFKNIEVPRYITEKMSKGNGYGQHFLFPNIFGFSEYDKKDKKNIKKIHQQFRNWMTKTITDPCWLRIDRGNDLKTMIKTIAKIPRGYKEMENFTSNKEEDAEEFMIFLLDLHPWESFMSLHSIKQVLFGANKSIDYLQNVGEEPVVE